MLQKKMSSLFSLKHFDYDYNKVYISEIILLYRNEGEIYEKTREYCVSEG